MNYLKLNRLAVIVFFTISFSAFLLGLFSLIQDGEKSAEIVKNASVFVRGVEVFVEIAKTNEELSRGLGGKETLFPNTGMLFVFGEDGIHSFWMKDMKFAIDMIWINKNGEIVDIKEDAKPEFFPERYSPRSNARFVLEVQSGFSKKHQINIGDRVLLPTFVLK
ncbi:MAG: hypothetical protein A3H57_00190 [Candidatus Taylorbacteria bacterium RIFCSPLOWO2_02_FULL_43_11]|uniref:DUF192 domain-containing protein n=1 Tax=Candidatus Taylorbacteria bacterium RIFCSPHIGHO2_02_FULL_43_32b TaxID=1802306 RepID=A0A1G2MFQ8_9BACT|nr:MAG: hypothetical protein A2743_03945 [Candidatus Taylorbacteria bacterium RIFCSPHIGHO2_01_FULL_43_47]OHA22736.1 MAG: hypothetical protein A3C72_03850 [Candidatus Taylorbacteria bacterium RIFCSPHIGHO2_02_FULL_43_32b]OHA29850.1 MAG: hypothetical protein A3B08_02170 [Candidatus Taylorbacteria bacterium RIFCSPLOWO2_01_FULL_43_44]OHA36485.1 MAG: hypothetical protein A3H57_00190 [Candidatus Taylorbacteria bacterium RIFCSPLOWO2_02_FULL_43_11]